MKNLTKEMLLLSALALGFASCSDDAPWGGSDSEGGINLKFASDARVMRQSRADDGMSPVVPDVSRFGVILAKSDNSYSKEWPSIDGFNKEKMFPIGDYTLTAFFGDTEQEGFENPCFRGSSEVHVSPGAVTDVDVVATLANAMVSVRYTDEFKSAFPAYSAAVQTAGHDWVVFAQDENRPAYVSPAEDVKLKLTLTDGANRRVEIQPASFNTVARHHYVVTIGVQGSQASGDLSLDVVFDDDVVAETVNVSLGEELFTAPAPTLTAKGFDPSSAIDSFEYAEQPAQEEFHVFAFGGLKSANLIVMSDAYTPTFGKSVELVGADDLTQKQLSEAGLVCSGFFRNADKMGVVNVTKFIESLPAGNYTVAMTAVDAMTRTTEPLELKVVVKPVDMKLSAIGNVGFMADEVKVQVSTNCPDIKNNVKFQVPNSRNQMVDAVVKSVEEVSAPVSARTRAELSHHFNYTLALEPQINGLVDVTAKVGRKSAAIKVPMTAPEYTITPDAFARKVVLKIESDDASVAKAIADRLSFENAGSAVATSNVSRDADGNTVIIGLTPGVEYVSLNAKIGTFEKTVPAFTTESETDVANGDFASGDQKRFEKIQTGGEFTGTIFSNPKYCHYANIVYTEPTGGWATLNSMTCYAGTNPQNTWFMVPSSYINGSGAAEIRSVGYSHNGSVPGLTKETAVWYCKNSPSLNQFARVAGELFLGSCNFDGANANRIDGSGFTSRPSSLTFQYKYANVGESSGEKGVVYVKLVGAGGRVLFESTKELGATSEMADVKIYFGNYPFGVKAEKIVLGFKSSNAAAPGIHIPSGTDLNDGGGLNNNNLGDNHYKALATGSVLTIDNVKLGYEVSSIATPSAAKRRSNRK